MSVLTEPGLLQSLTPFLEEAKSHAVEIRQGDTVLGVIISTDDYEIVRQAKVDRALRAMDELGNLLRREAAQAGICVEELEKMLDRKSP